jgi:acetaldehyde dehydrogenase
VLNPADPPMIMARPIFCASPARRRTWNAVADSFGEMVADVASYVPGYRLLNEPQFDETGVPNRTAGSARRMARVSIFVEVEGAGDFLPRTPGTWTS